MADATEPQPTAASQLLQQHHGGVHHTTVEDAIDDDAINGGSSSGANGTDPSRARAEPTATNGPGTRNAQAPMGLDTKSRELFPELGGSTTKAGGGRAPVVWGAGKNVNGQAKGATSSNGSPRGQVPVSLVGSPSLNAAPAVNIPGRNVETLFLDPQHVMSRAQLKRPLPDIIKDMNRKSRAIISMSTSGNGRLKFEAVGPRDVAQQALLDLVQQIGSKVSIGRSLPFLKPICGSANTKISK